MKKKKKKTMSDVSKGYKKNTLFKENNNKISYVIEVKKKKNGFRKKIMICLNHHTMWNLAVIGNILAKTR